MPRQPDYLSRVEAAQYLGLTPQRIAALSYSGRLGRQIAGHWVYTKVELDGFNLERAQRPKGGRPAANASKSAQSQ